MNEDRMEMEAVLRNLKMEKERSFGFLINREVKLKAAIINFLEEMMFLTRTDFSSVKSFKKIFNLNFYDDLMQFKTGQDLWHLLHEHEKALETYKVKSEKLEQQYKEMYGDGGIG